jgi:pSer/pThr/pTyr-binding forkhead associated (FHA) protein
VKIEVPGGDRARTVRHTPLRIGRQSDNDIHLLDKTVHGYHAVVVRTADGLSVIDDVSGPSGNGIKINGRALRHAVLQPGDVIELGKARLRVVAGRDAFDDSADETSETSTREQAA